MGSTETFAEHWYYPILALLTGTGILLNKIAFANISGQYLCVISVLHWPACFPRAKGGIKNNKNQMKNEK